MTRLAIITARGGSKRIARKNIRPFLGTPIIGYVISAAREAGCFDEVMVSTDDHEIAMVARSFGASVPFMRSAATSGDHATTCEALLEVLAEYERRGLSFDQACCLYPAAPFITAESLNRSLEVMERAGAASLVPVAEFTAPIFRALKVEGDRLSMFWPETRSTRSQDLPKAYYDAGQFYWFNVARFLETRVINGDDAAPFVLPWSEVQDIDTLDDWEQAEFKYQMLYRPAGRPALRAVAAG